MYVCMRVSKYVCMCSCVGMSVHVSVSVCVCVCVCVCERECLREKLCLIDSLSVFV